MAKINVATPVTDYLGMQSYRSVVRGVPIFKPTRKEFKHHFDHFNHSLHKKHSY
jgi:hypothetical protein